MHCIGGFSVPCTMPRIVQNVTRLTSVAGDDVTATALKAIKSASAEEARDRAADKAAKKAAFDSEYDVGGYPALSL